MKKCLVLAKLKSSDEHSNVGIWILVTKEEETQVVKNLGDRFIFSFDLDETDDQPLLSII